MFGVSGDEFCNRSLHPSGVNPLLLEGLQFLREWFDVPFVITSPYRCLAYNRRIGSSDGSQHPKNTAADVRAKGVRCEEVMQIAEQFNLFTGRGLYPDDDFCHFDVRGGLLALPHTRIARWVRVDGVYVNVQNFDKWL